MQYLTVQYVTVQYLAVQYLTVQYLAVQYLTVQYLTVQYLAVQYLTVQYPTVQYLTVQYLTANMKALHISETSGNIHPTQSHIPDEMNLHVSGFQTVVQFNGLARTFRRTPSVLLLPDSVFDRFANALPFVLRFPTAHVGTFVRNVERNSCDSLRIQKKAVI
jgi:hypothetical protein